MMKAPREGRRNEPKSQNFSETTEAEVILQTEHWLKNKFGKEYNLAAYEAKSKSQFTSIECLYERNWHICARRVTRYTQSLGTAYERLAAGQGIMGESAHNDSQGTFRSSAAPRPFAQC